MRFRPLRPLAVVLVLLGSVLLPATADATEGAGDDVPTDTGATTVTAAAATPPPITFPVEGPVAYTDSFGACRSGCTRSHAGNDLMGTKLQRLLAARDSRVTWLRDTATPTGSRANILVLEDSAGWEYWYIHINNDTPGTDDGANPARWRFAPGIGIGSTVRAGQHVAYMGDSGNAEETGAHVHFEIHEPGGTPIDPYPSLRNARRFVLDTSSEPPIVADIDADPAAEVLLYNPGPAADHRFDGTGESGVFDRGAIQVNGTYDPLVGDFDGNGYDDIIWYAPGAAADYIWWYSASGYRSAPTRIQGSYQPLVGDFDRNGFDDILWYAPGGAADYLWWYGPSGHRSEPRLIVGDYDPVIGDFDGNGYEDILWYAPGGAEDYLWSYHAGGYDDRPRTIQGTYEPMVGDFDGDTLADIYWYRAGTGADYLWMHRPGGTYRDIRADHDETQRPGVGDLDGDGRDDLIWFDPGVSDPDAVWEFDGNRFVRHAAVVN